MYLDIVASHASLAGGHVSGGFSCVCVMRAAASCMRARTRPSYFGFLLRARYKDMTDGGRLIGFFPRAEDARLKGRQVVKAVSLSLVPSPEALLRDCAPKLSAEEFEIAGSDSRGSGYVTRPVCLFSRSDRFANLNIDHSTIRAK